MKVDTNGFLGAYPFADIPGTEPEDLLSAMDRVGIDQTWVSHLPSLFWRDPMAGNRVLLELVTDYHRLKPVPVIHPGLPKWRDELDRVAEVGVVAVRADPVRQGLDPAGEEMAALANAVAARGLPLTVAFRLEDGRQRHPIDGSGELPCAAIRKLIRSSPELRLLVTHASRNEIEEVHFGSIPTDSSRIWWDVSWIWGPPEDHLAILWDTVGRGRFVLGTGQPLRLPEAAMAKLELLEQSPWQQLERNVGSLGAGLKG